MTVRSGAGAPLSGRKLRLWYVQHADINDPATVTLTHDLRSFVMQGVAPHATEGNPISLAPPEHGTPLTCWEGTTDNAGRVSFEVATNDLTHGPSFDVWADYLPRHERYHINALLHDQSLTKPAPPSLTAQSKLIQDYHWTTGGQIDESRSRPTYRVVVRCANDDNSPRIGERIEVSAKGHAVIEVLDTQYSVNEQNSQTFYADQNGQLIIVMSADDLKPPCLSLWAGFMNSESRYIIDPAQDAHQQMSKVQGDAMKNASRMTNWRPEKSGGPQRGSLLKSDYHPHADEIAATVRHVMSSTGAQERSNGKSAQPVAADAIRSAAATVPASFGTTASKDSFSDMTQPIAIPLGDEVRALPTMRHIHRTATVTPEFLHQSLQLSKRGAVGFSLKFKADTQAFSFTYLTEETKAAAMGTPSSPTDGIQAAGFFSFVEDLWDDVKSVAESIAEKATEIAVTVGDAIIVAVHTIDSVAHIVVNSIEQAVDIVVDFIKKIALEIWQIIQFLLMLFDWGDVVFAHKVVKDCIKNSAARFLHEFGQPGEFARLVSPLTDLLGIKIDIGDSAQSIASIQPTPGKGSDMVANANGVGANAIRDKAKQYAGDVKVLNPVSALQGDPITHAVSDIISKMISLASDLPHMSPGDAASALLELLKSIAEDLLKALIEEVDKTIVTMAQAAKALIDAFDSKIEIPFLSMLYKWITGEDLSMLDLFCLVMGAAVHIIAVITTQKNFGALDGAHSIATSLGPPTSSPRSLGVTAMAASATQDLGIPTLVMGQAAQLPGEHITLELPKPSPTVKNPLNWGGNDTRAIEMLYLALRGANAFFTLCTDGLFFEEAVRSSPNKERSMFKIGRAVCGIAADCILFTCSNPDYYGKVANALTSDRIEPNKVLFLDWDLTVKIQTISAFGLGTVGNLITLGSGIKGVGFSADAVMPGQGIEMTSFAGGRVQNVPSPGQPFPSTSISTMDKLEFTILSCRSFFLLFTILLSIVRGAAGHEYTKGADSGLRTAQKLLLARDVLIAAAKLPAPMYTQTFFRNFGGESNPEAYVASALIRAATNFSALVLHGVAEYGYLL